MLCLQHGTQELPANDLQIPLALRLMRLPNLHTDTEGVPMCCQRLRQRGAARDEGDGDFVWLVVEHEYFR
jgi:hypothetical protein